MKIKLVLSATILLSLVMLRCEPSESVMLCGTWRMIQGEYTGPELQVNQDETTRICYKILAEDHFAVIEMFPDNPDSLFFAAVGTFELAGNRYIESYTASNVVSKIGQSLEFHSEIKGDVWHLNLKTQELSLSETWQRIEGM